MQKRHLATAVGCRKQVEPAGTKLATVPRTGRRRHRAQRAHGDAFTPLSGLQHRRFSSPFRIWFCSFSHFTI
eukprot:241299-Prymnesium_polylepis.2